MHNLRKKLVKEMISIKNEQEIDLMRKSGRITYEVLMNLKDIIKLVILAGLKVCSDM